MSESFLTWRLHKGGILENRYRKEDRAMATTEVRDYIKEHFPKEEFYFGSSNERFRRQLYDIYLGGLDAEKFPRLFKRAIPFKMNIKLEDFVREYICMDRISRSKICRKVFFSTAGCAGRSKIR